MVQEAEIAQVPAPIAKRGLVQTWAAVLLQPAEFFESIREGEPLGPPFRFAYLMALATWAVVASFAVAGRSVLPNLGLPMMLIATAALMAQLPLLIGFRILWRSGCLDHRKVTRKRRCFLQTIGGRRLLLVSDCAVEQPGHASQRDFRSGVQARIRGRPVRVLHRRPRRHRSASFPPCSDVCGSCGSGPGSGVPSAPPPEACPDGAT